MIFVLSAAVTTTSAQTRDDMVVKGQAIANQDPLAAELRNRQPDGPIRRGFDIGMAAAEGQTQPGPSKQALQDSLDLGEREGFATAVSFSLERNRNADLAARGAAIAATDPIVAKARTVESDVFYRLGFDIATGIFGDTALGGHGRTSTGPGSLGIRDSLSTSGRRGFNASVALHLRVTAGGGGQDGIGGLIGIQLQGLLPDRQQSVTLSEQVAKKQAGQTSTDSGREPVKPVGRVRLPPGTAPSPGLPICDAARVARARNSPAAPGLEATCAATRANEVSGAAAAAGAISATQADNTVNVRVSYKRVLGYKGYLSSLVKLGPTSCDAFLVSAELTDYSTRSRYPIAINSDSRMEDAGVVYVCNYLVSGIPLDQPVSVRVGVFGPDLLAAWKGDGEARPPVGQQRTILDASRTAILNVSQPRAKLSFEMVYAPVESR
jgi:hypothetical protein